jgi:hypothetical protein
MRGKTTVMKEGVFIEVKSICAGEGRRRLGDFCPYLGLQCV